MGIGLNAAHDPGFKDYELTKLPDDPKGENTPTMFLPPGADDATIQGYKREFANWVVACGLREVLDAYGLFIARLHHDALVVYQSGRGLLKHLGDPDHLQRKFHENPGIAHKLDTLESRFGIRSEYGGEIKQLYRLRNAIDHNFRVVLEKQLDQSQQLTVRWLATSMFGIGGKSGERKPLSNSRANCSKRIQRLVCLSAGGPSALPRVIE